MKWKDYCNKILTTIDAEAFFIDEFKTKNLVYHRNGEEIKAQCPFVEKHLKGQDSNPSFTINVSNGVYFCNACGSKGNIHTYYMITRNLTKQEAWYELGDALNIERPTTVDSRLGIDPGLPTLYMNKLKELTGVIPEMLQNKRGLKKETLEKFNIGWDGERVTLPLYDEFNELVNIRRYKWNSYEDNTKMINFTDELQNSYGEDRIFGIEHLYDETVKDIVWCEGEWDRLVTEQLGLPACTSTAGASNFKFEWFKLLRNKKRIYICYDNDDTGRRATSQLIENLKNGPELLVVDWPKDWYEKGDITDYIVKDGHTKEEFLELFKPASVEQSVPTVGLAVSSNARYAGKRIKIPVLVAGKENAPFVFPKHIRVTCSSGDEDSKLCASCYLCKAKRKDITLDSDKASLLRMIDCSDEQQRKMLTNLAGVNSKCFAYEYNVLEYGNLETIHMIPKVEANFGFATRQEYVSRSGFLIGNNIPTNKRYTLVGYMHADPRSQKATYIFDKAVPDKDLLDDFEITTEMHEVLKEFQCAEGQSVADKFNEIHTDLERNVTYIWDRRNVGYAVDLVYHTALSFTFQEQQVKRGWAECLIIGDSGQAKTTLVERLMSHYRSGELLSGESSKRTGLVYNIQQSGGSSSWTLMWGAMPLNDGGLLTVDELSGMAEDDLAKMSDVRSSGVAKATGVVTAETTARTRMIFISNPRNGRQLKAENYGVSAILKLFGKAEDVRRLDFALAVASGEVDSDIVNRAVSDMPEVQHRYTSDKCKTRVAWAWSRKPENIIFTPESVKTILECAAIMGKKYSSRIPLVEPADQRLKLARLSVAAAACVYSTDDGTNVIVKPEHVTFVFDYLNSVYTKKSLGYDRFSADEFENSDTSNEAISKLRMTYATLPLVNNSPGNVAASLYKMPYFNRNTLEDATGLDRDEMRALTCFLIGNAIVEKAGQDYKRTPMGLAFIEELLMNPLTQDEIKEARAQHYKKREI